jgi:hypothetical protein
MALARLPCVFQQPTPGGEDIPETRVASASGRAGHSVKNMLLEKIEYKEDETSFGTWRRFVYPTGELFEEFTAHQVYFGLPLVHYTRGRCPETGKRVVARGIVAVGRLAVGVVAIGQASAGILAIGQLALGLVFGLGQASTGTVALGQLAVGLLFGLGQITTGYVAIGQFALGKYVLAQLGLGQYVWDTRGASAAAQQFFRSLIR